MSFYILDEVPFTGAKISISESFQNRFSKNGH